MSLHESEGIEMASAPSDNFEKKSFMLGRVFKPATPINREDLFAGRKRQVQQVVDAINQDGRHVLLFGERGVGKTSLANMLFTRLSCSGRSVFTPKTNCVNQDTFGSIWKRVLEDLQEGIDGKVGEESASLVADLVEKSEGEISPDTIRKLLTAVGEEGVLVIILDEFDTIESEATRQEMADTLKFLSDRNVPATVVLIGVADDVEELIYRHHSIERCLVQIPMPRMSQDEINSVVDTCLSLVGMSIDGQAGKGIAYVSKGLPHYAHLLGLYSGRAALASKNDRISKVHVIKGMEEAIENVQASVQALYRKAISSARQDAQYKKVLLACALATTDEFGFFAPIDVRGPLSKLRGGSPAMIEAFARHLHAFAQDDRGPVLRREELGKGRIRFRFSNPLVQPFVLMKGVTEGAIAKTEMNEAATTPGDDPIDGMLF